MVVFEGRRLKDDMGSVVRTMDALLLTHLDITHPQPACWWIRIWYIE